jgi:ABC-type transport system involved in cytochrome c biogenesis permease subunit
MTIQGFKLQQMFLYGITGMTCWFVPYCITTFFYSDIFWYPPISALITGFLFGLIFYLVLTFLYYKSTQKDFVNFVLNILILPGSKQRS